MRDLIERQAAIDALEQIFDRCEEIEVHLPKGDPDRTGYKMYPDYMTVWKYLHTLPSEQPRKGKWSKEMIGATPYKYRCSKCNKYSRAMYDFCPNCGADMRGEKNG